MTKKRVTKSTFSVALSIETGCIVMVRTNGQQVTVVGSLTREQSLGLADSIVDWKIAAEVAGQATIAPRPQYPH